ncbi:hypothetical protein [Dyella sp. ASV21]|uniref:hypothetical protein n=1 Tax=Dyella sp. ASV21 TaxID=2795114 RepID=UPI0018EBB2B9|nr:hypothetical protein [Dyella sp. ASV21]
MNEPKRRHIYRTAALATLAMAATALAMPAQAQHDRHGGEHRQEAYYGHDDHRRGSDDFAIGAVMGVAAGAAIEGAYQPPPVVVYQTAPPPPPPGVVYYANGYPP